MTVPGPPTNQSLRLLVGEIMTVVRRHVPNWDVPAGSDPAVALLDLFAWLADALATYQDEIASEGSLQTRRRLGVIAYHLLSDASLAVTVDGVLWQQVASWSETRSTDRVYVAETANDGTTAVQFGDGRIGALPLEGSEVAATYRTGAGAGGLTATVRWPPERRVIAVRVGDNRLALESAPRGREDGLFDPDGGTGNQDN